MKLNYINQFDINKWFWVCNGKLENWKGSRPIVFRFVFLHVQLILSLAYLSSVPHVDEGTHGLEGTGATGQEVSAVVGLQETNKVGTLRL